MTEARKECLFMAQTTIKYNMNNRHCRILSVAVGLLYAVSPNLETVMDWLVEEHVF